MLMKTCSLYGLISQENLNGFKLIQPYTPPKQHHWWIRSCVQNHKCTYIIRICWFGAQETFLIIISVENSCAASYFFLQDSLINTRISIMSLRSLLINRTHPCW